MIYEGEKTYCLFAFNVIFRIHFLQPYADLALGRTLFTPISCRLQFHFTIFFQLSQHVSESFRCDLKWQDSEMSAFALASQRSHYAFSLATRKTRLSLRAFVALGVKSVGGYR